MTNYLVIVTRFRDIYGFVLFLDKKVELRTDSQKIPSSNVSFREIKKMSIYQDKEFVSNIRMLSRRLQTKKYEAPFKMICLS